MRSVTMRSLPVEFVAFHGRKNIIMTLIKNYDSIELLKYLPITLSIYTSAIPYYLYKRRPDQAIATMKAIAWNISHLKKNLEKRNKIKKLRKVHVTDKMDAFDIMQVLYSNKIWPK